ncbi:MAG: hypothetical protein ACP5HM_02900 [Anaerolineae bacterium]
MKRAGRVIAYGILGLLTLFIVAALLSALSNLGLPQRSEVVERLSGLQKAYLAEALHLRRELGDAVWAGWGTAEIPFIVYNETYAFLVNYAGEPPMGWRTVPAGEQQGNVWEVVSDDTFEGQAYYRSRLPASGETPQAFTVRLDDVWAASLGTRESMRIALVAGLREELPAPLDVVVPYRLVRQLLLGPGDQYVAALLHESFHAYQGLVAPERLRAGEKAHRFAADYPAQEEDHVALWEEELRLLREALRAETDAEAMELARQFLAHRERRRAGLDADLILYEQHREWVEGLAKYTEMEIWRQAAVTPDYAPVAALADIEAFKDYETFERHWSQQVDQIARMAGNEGDGRFYYSGMAQAYLLDRLAPGWKDECMAGDAFLDERLQRVLE